MLFVQVRQTECDLFLLWNITCRPGGEEIEAALPLKEITVSVNAPYHRDAKKYDKPTVSLWICRQPRRVLFTAMQKGEVTDDAWSRHAARLFSVYFGGDMSSLMFQEIREFRSLAYRVSGRYILPPHKLEGKAGEFVTMLSHTKRQDAGCFGDNEFP